MLDHVSEVAAPRRLVLGGMPQREGFPEMPAFGDRLTEDEFVPQVRALVIEPQAPRELPAPHRERQPDQIVGVDQVERRCVEIELGVDRAVERELHPFAEVGSVRAEDPEPVGDPDRADIGAERGRRGSAHVAQERPVALRIRDERAEKIAAREPDEAQALFGGDAGVAQAPAEVSATHGAGSQQARDDEQGDPRDGREAVHGIPPWAASGRGRHGFAGCYGSALSNFAASGGRRGTRCSNRIARVSSGSP